MRGGPAARTPDAPRGRRRACKGGNVTRFAIVSTEASGVEVRVMAIDEEVVIARHCAGAPGESNAA